MFALFLSTSFAHIAASDLHSVIHIIVDDLRPELDAYGVLNTHTPNIDRIAANGTVFDRAYCQQAVCGPSRNSFMTGRRPDSSRSWNFINHFREDHPGWTTIPGLFLKSGAQALGSGKSFHPKLPPKYDSDKSWSKAGLPYRNPCWNTADQTVFSFQDGGLPCVFCPIDIKDRLGFKVNVSIANEYCSIDAYEDTFTIDFAKTLLKKVKNEHFYMAVGLHKPHMPWQYSPEDLAKHPIESISLPRNRLPPTDMPGIAFHFTDEKAPNHTDPWNYVNDEDTLNARRAYRAAVTGMDRKLGELLDELQKLGLWETTAIVLHGDHGWHLGEQGEWRKFTNFETATRVPLIVRAPWLHSSTMDGTVRRSSALVELVDVLPTIAELGGLSLPADETFEGQSMAYLLGDQTKENATVATRDAAFSQYPRRVKDPSKPWSGNSIIHHNRSEFTHMGYSIRTAEWRYTEWVLWNGSSLRPIWSNVTARELYDHRNETIFPTDFDVGESVNVASDPTLVEVINTLSNHLRDQFGH